MIKHSAWKSGCFKKWGSWPKHIHLLKFIHQKTLFFLVLSIFKHLLFSEVTLLSLLIRIYESSTCVSISLRTPHSYFRLYRKRRRKTCVTLLTRTRSHNRNYTYKKRKAKKNDQYIHTQLYHLLQPIRYVKLSQENSEILFIFLWNCWKSGRYQRFIIGWLDGWGQGGRFNFFQRKRYQLKVFSIRFIIPWHWN